MKLNLFSEATWNRIAAERDMCKRKGNPFLAVDRKRLNMIMVP